MTHNEEVQRILQALANGINPNTGEVMENLDDLFTPEVLDALNYARVAIDFRDYWSAEEAGEQEPFSLSQEEKSKIWFRQDQLLPVGKIALTVNRVLPPRRIKLSPAKIEQWLSLQKYLEDVEFEDGTRARRLGWRGQGIGAEEKLKVDPRGKKYYSILWPREIQWEIVDHAEEIMANEKENPFLFSVNFEEEQEREKKEAEEDK